MNMSPLQRKFVIKQRIYSISVTLSRLILFLGFIGIWEFTADKGIINAFIFSSPVRLYQTFMDLAKDGVIFMHIWVTLYETIVAFAIITVVGIIFAILLWCFKGLSDCLEPFMVVLNSLPKSALAPMLIVWLGTNTKAIIITAVSVAIFGMIINLYTGFLGIDKEKITLIRTLGGNKWHILCKLIIPGSKKIIISNMKVNIGLCLVGVIIGEFLAAKKGLGYLIIYGSQVFKMSYVVLAKQGGFMLSLTIKDLKQFMNKLLISDTFDGMCLSEAYICTGCSYTIDGKLNTDFYNEDELNSMPSARYTSWKNIKPFAFSIIKGRKVPELLKITFVLPEAVVAKLILDTDLNFDPDCVNGLFLNVRYQDGSVTMTTASSLSTFTLDRSLDEAFERYIINFLSDADISYEE